MDRFIDKAVAEQYKSKLFKIQYGQIYSINIAANTPLVIEFKIQYGQIYRSSKGDGILCPVRI